MSNANDPAAAQAACGASVSTNNPQQAPPAPATAQPASPRKRAANRANARHSTGPRTVAGKARVRMNAVRHGLASQAAVLPGEDPEELAALARAYEADLRPRGALERDLVARIVGINWRLRRVARAEEAMWARQDHDIVERAESGVTLCQQFGLPPMPGAADGPIAPMTGAEFAAGQMGRTSSSALERLAVYEQRLDRSLHAAIRELRALRELRAEGMDLDEEDGRDDGAAPATGEDAGIGDVGAEPLPLVSADDGEPVVKAQEADGGVSEARAPAPPACGGAEERMVRHEPPVDAGTARADASGSPRSRDRMARSGTLCRTKPPSVRCGRERRRGLALCDDLGEFRNAGGACTTGP